MTLSRLPFLSLRCLSGLVMLAAFCALTGTAAAQITSQTPPPSEILTLNAETQAYRVAPVSYVTAGPLTSTVMYDRYMKGMRGENPRGEVIPLTARSTPHWIIFNVVNQTWTEDWVLSFGSHKNGRMGLVERALLFDSSGKSYLDINPPQRGTPRRPPDATNAVDLPLPRGQHMLFFLYVVPKPGLPTTIAPSLMPKTYYEAQIRDMYKGSRGIAIVLALMAGLCAASVILKRYGAGLLFGAYYMAQFALLTYNDSKIFTPGGVGVEVPAWLGAFAIICGLFGTQVFLSIHRAMPQARALYCVAGLVAVSILLANFVMPADSILRPFLIVTPFIVAQFFLFLLSVAQGYNRETGAYLLGFGWLTLAVGSTITFLGYTKILPPMESFLSAYWQALIVQAVFFTAAMAVKFHKLDNEDSQRALSRAEEEENLAIIRQGKEAAENQRLKRLIEHERQAMNELRSREVEQNENMRAAKEMADEANRAKSAFLAVVSHEIRTPMSGIMGMVRLLLESNLAKDQYDYAQTIQDSGEAMLSLLNDILDFEKIENNKMDIEHLDFDLHRLIQGIGTLMSGHAAAKGIYLKVAMDSNVPRYVIGDPVRLRQVLLNLSGNSIKFTQDGGVTVRVGLDPTVGQSASNMVHRIRFSIEDTGIGISKEAQKNLFNPFAQADNSIARKFGGTGLGLAISQRLIEAMGGRIQIDSTEGHGSTFYFTLIMENGSADAVQQGASSSTSPMQKHEQALRILIVEDNEINQKLMREFVSRMGHETTMAGTGEESLQIVEAEDRFDAILMDVELPGISGMGATKAIRAMADRDKAATPVIALTGNVRDEDIRNCYAANMNGHLSKPVDPKLLKNMLDKVIANTLDNPVELAEPAAQNYTRMNRLDIGADEHIGVTPVSGPSSQAGSGPLHTSEPAPSSMPASDHTSPLADLVFDDGTPVMAALDLHDMDAPSASQDAAPAPESATDGNAPAPGHEAFAMSTEDLSFMPEDEDSFAMAIAAAEAAESAAQQPGGAAAAARPAFDTAVLGGIRTAMGPEGLKELIDGLLEKGDEIIGVLHGNAETLSLEDIVARAHELKGMAGNFGLMELSHLAAQAERKARESSRDGLADILDAMPVAMEQAKTALDDWMNG